MMPFFGITFSKKPNIPAWVLWTCLNHFNLRKRFKHFKRFKWHREIRYFKRIFSQMDNSTQCHTLHFWNGLLFCGFAFAEFSQKTASGRKNDPPRCMLKRNSWAFCAFVAPWMYCRFRECAGVAFLKADNSPRHSPKTTSDEFSEIRSFCIILLLGDWILTA